MYLHYSSSVPARTQPPPAVRSRRQGLCHHHDCDAQRSFFSSGCNSRARRSLGSGFSKRPCSNYIVLLHRCLEDWEHHTVKAIPTMATNGVNPPSAIQLALSGQIHAQPGVVVTKKIDHRVPVLSSFPAITRSRQYYGHDIGTSPGASFAPVKNVVSCVNSGLKGRVPADTWGSGKKASLGIAMVTLPTFDV